MPYVLNGQNVSLGEEPTEHEGRHYVPLEPVLQSLGGTVSWDNETKTATATAGKWTASVQMANPVVDVSGTQVTLADPPYVENDTLYVPWYFFRDAFGYKAEMDGDTLQVHL
jgi:hypothetical protein